MWQKWMVIDSSKLWHEAEAQLVQLFVVCFLAWFEGIRTLAILFFCGYCRHHHYHYHHLCGGPKFPSILMVKVRGLEFQNAVV